MNCPKCGHELSDRATMCPYCGADFENLSDESRAYEKYCIYCGRKIPMDAAFCIHCGKKQSGEKTVNNFEKSRDGTQKSEAQESSSPNNETGTTNDSGSQNGSENQAGKQNDTENNSKTFREIAHEIKKELTDLINEKEETRNDAACPFCGEENCQPVQKSIIETRQKNYGWGSGCCGMLLFGPFGLLCGLCGSGSKTKTSSELWWTCPKCGKQHLALADALNKWETMLGGLLTNSLLVAAIFAVLRWFDIGILTVLVVLGSFVIPIMGIVGMHQELSEEFGGPISDYLSPDQKKACLWVVLIAIIIILVGSFLGLRLLEYFAEL